MPKKMKKIINERKKQTNTLVARVRWLSGEGHLPPSLTTEFSAQNTDDGENQLAEVIF